MTRKAPSRPVIPIRPTAGEVANAGDADDGVHFVSMYQKQPDIYPRAVKGWFATWRWTFVWLTQILFYGLPWLQWGGRQAVLFDLDAQRFYIFGLLLYPQDLIFLAALLVLSALALFFFTAVAGRLWCGYTCPQTVLFTGFSFVGYFTPIRELSQAVLTLAVTPWNAFWILFYGAATYGNAGYLREQMCKYMCPYARFQSALIDKDSLVITYDSARGDPRGSRSRKQSAAAQGLGDCIDCTLCVQVCPTGIDIRDGLQNECIGCAACIDVCDDVMAKMNYPKGLIRYSTENGVVNGWSKLQMFKRALRPRVLIYGGLLSAASVAFAASVALRSPFQVDVVKDRGALARVVEDGAIENVYRLQIMNRTEQPQTYRIDAQGIPGLEVQTEVVRTPPAGISSVVVSLRLPYSAAQGLLGQSAPVQFEVNQLDGTRAAAAVQREKSTFFVPR